MHDDLDLPDDGPRGTGHHRAYHALWHLQKIGVVDDLKTFTSSAWDDADQRIEAKAKRTRVAMIDTSVACKHPNLKDAIATDLAIDFFSHPLGVPLQPASDALKQLIQNGTRPLPDFLHSKARPFWTDFLEHLQKCRKAALNNERPRVRPATRSSFSAHGTAMAGLIGARPLAPHVVKIAKLRPFDVSTGGETDPVDPGLPVGFAYAGVDPFCEIVPISTNFDPEPEQLIIAMLHAVLIGAEVIVLARDFPAPKGLAHCVEPETAEAYSAALGVGLSEEEMANWDLLERIVKAVSLRVPIVCASGNGADDFLLYPASLAEPGNGIIAVGARTAAGQPASYTPKAAVTVYAPSGDGERLDAAMQRLDTVDAGYRAGDQSQCYVADLHNFGDDPVVDADRAARFPKSNEHTYSPQDLISTDVPGRAGYNSSPYTQVFTGQTMLDYRSAFCRFSGTSGAVAVTAGLISLGISAGRISTGRDGDGLAVKRILRGDSNLCHNPPAEPAVHWRHFPPKP